jgi:hypothetical protein
MLSAPVAVNTQAMAAVRGGVAMGGMPAVEGMPFSTSAEILFAGSRVVGIHHEAVGYFRDRLRSAPS